MGLEHDTNKLKKYNNSLILNKDILYFFTKNNIREKQYIINKKLNEIENKKQEDTIIKQQEDKKLNEIENKQQENKIIKQQEDKKNKQQEDKIIKLIISS